MGIPELILSIIHTLLLIVLEAMKGQTAEQKAKMWDRHLERMEWWEGLFKRFSPGTPPPAASRRRR